MVLLDGIIYSLQKIGGISVYFDAILKKVSEEKINSSLLLFNNKNIDYLSNINIIKSKSRFLERYRKSKIVPASVFHSSYYRNPENNRIPVILTVHDFIYEKIMTGYKRKIHIAQKRAAIQRAETIICVSNTTKNDLLDLYDVKDKNIIVIPNGVSDTYRPINLEGEKKYILYVGSRASYKNFNVALGIIENTKDIDLWVVGHEILDVEISSLSEKNHNRVIWKGSVNEVSLNEIYNNAICLIYPSTYEGFGIPVLEAFRARCPVVIGGCAALLEFGEENLHICSSNNIDEYVEKVKLIINQNRSQITIGGYLHSLNYSWDKSTIAHVDLYKKYL